MEDKPSTLHPLPPDTSRLSTTTLSFFYEAYSTPSPSHSRSSSIDSDPRPPLAITTAHRRNSSPVPSLEGGRRGSAEEVLGEGGVGGGGLHRRSSSRVRAGVEGSSGRRGEVGWGAHGSPSPSPTSPRRRKEDMEEGSSSARERQRWSIPIASDGEREGDEGERDSGSFIRPLPRTPPSHAPFRQDSGPSIRPLPVPRTPERQSSTDSDLFRRLPQTPVGSRGGKDGLSYLDPRTISAVRSGVTFDISPPDDPLSSTFSLPLHNSDSLETLSPFAGNEDVEEYTSRSPLQPSPAGTPIHRSRSLRTPGSSPGQSRRLSNLVIPGGSPSSLKHLSAPPSPLVRKKSLTAAADVLRRMSVRVVNVAGADTEEIMVEQSLENEGEERVGGRHIRMEDQEIGLGLRGEEEGDGEGEVKVETTKLTGWSLGFLGPTNSFRKGCAGVLRWRGTEPIILILIILSVVILTIQSAPSVYTHPRPTSGYFHSWEDYVLFVLFIFFTIEIIARVVVTGLVINPAETIDLNTNLPSSPSAYSPHPLIRSSSPNSLQRVASNPFEAIRARLSTSPSPSQNRDNLTYPPTQHQTKKDTYSSTWSSHGTGTSLFEPSRRTQNASTDTTATASTSFSKRSRNSLGPNVAAATPFVLSIRRQRTTYQQAFLRHSWNRLDAIAVVSFWIAFVLAETGEESRDNLYIFRALSVLRATRLLSITEGTTTILQSLKRASPQLVNVAFFVAFAVSLFSVIGVQSFKGSFRRTCEWIDPAGIIPSVNFPNQHCGGYVNVTTGLAEGYIAASGIWAGENAKGFICPSPSICIETQNPTNGVMSFDNIFASLLQVVIVASANTWSTIMYEMMDADFYVSCLFFIVCLIVLNYWLINMFVAVITNTFGGIMDDTKHSAFANSTINATVQAAASASAHVTSQGRNFLRKVYKATQYFWVGAVLVDIALQATKTSDMSDGQLATLDLAELYFTIAFAVEIVIRTLASLPQYRTMVTRPQNAMDLFLVIMTCLIRIPPIHNSTAYPWLTAFQILRFYRVILAIPRTKRLLVRVLGTFTGLINMIVFMILMTFIAALIAVQLVRGVPQTDDLEDPTMTFFQIFNAFLAMYQLLSSENWTNTLSNVLASEAGQVQIVIAAVFLSGWMLFSYFILVNMFIAVINENFAIAEEVKHQLQEEEEEKRKVPPAATESWIHRFRPYLRRSPPKVEEEDDESDSDEKGTFRTPALILQARTALGVDTLQDVTSSAANQPGGPQLPRYPENYADLATYIERHPGYDRSLWIFSQKNPIRKICQKFVNPSSGDMRFEGRPARPNFRFAFQGFVFAAVVGSIAIAAIANPVFRRTYLLEHGEVRWTWFNLTEVGLGSIFILEFLVKVIADGFLYAPNAYLLSMWNGLDFFVLVTLVVNVATSLLNPSGYNRLTRALTALRALRLITLSPTIRKTFYDVLIVGAGQIFDASLLAILYIIPFAIWGQNVFSGLLYSCNDTSVTTKAECIGEFLNSAVSDWAFVTPRIWSNPYMWTFDSFGASLLILFQIISLEGWISVMESVMGITGRDLQPQAYASQFNSLFFVAYNLIGAVFILTIFVSVIIANFTRRSGMSLLTSEQRQWIDLKKLITLQRPAKRPKRVPRSRFRHWCYDRAIQKHGWWSTAMTVVYCVHIVILMTQAFDQPAWVETMRNYIFLAITLIFLTDVLVRMVGLGWLSFTGNGWNLFDCIVVAGTLATTIIILKGTSSQVAIQFQKLFLVSIAFKLVQKNNSLNQLFKTATTSLPTILSIFALWLVLFLVWSICDLEILGLTRWGVSGTRTANFSTFFNAMVLLEIFSTGEGWNSFMYDYLVQFPACTSSPDPLFSDCGSPGWAYALFISWNVLSMYLMSNLILGAVVENFSYVFQVYGKVKMINREQMRSFKKAWAQFDPERSGYIKKADIVPFLGRLSGVFEVKVYPHKWSLPRMFSQVIDGKHGSDVKGRHVDILKLDLLLHTIDPSEVARRRARYNQLYHEVMLESERTQYHRVSFNKMLLLLAHTCLVSDDKALKPEERREREAAAHAALVRVKKSSVQALMKTMIQRRRYLAEIERLRQARSGAPAIIVEGDELPRNSSTTNLITRQISNSPPSSPDTSPTRPLSRIPYGTAL